MTKTTATSISHLPYRSFAERPDGTIAAGTCNEQAGAKAEFGLATTPAPRVPPQLAQVPSRAYGRAGGRNHSSGEPGPTSTEPRLEF